MNLIEAWKEAKKGQIVSRPSWMKTYLTKEDYPLRTKVLINISEGDLLADDWEIVKEKHVVVIEGVSWYKDESGAKVIYPLAHHDSTKFRGLLNKSLMKMTLEWEE